MRMKIFAVVLTVMCLVSCMCMTAFAAESAPPYASTIVNGVEFQTLGNFGGMPPYFEVVPGVEYTITADMAFALQWWNGKGWNYWPDYNAVESPATIVFDESIRYVAISSHGYTSDIATAVVSWEVPPEPTFYDYGFSWLEFLVAGGLSVLDMLISHPVTRLLIAGTLAVSAFLMFKVLI